MKALVVDDSEIQRYFLRGVLEADGWEVVEADGVAAGLARAGGCALVCLDVHLADGGAADVLRALDAAPRGRGAVVVLVSADGDGLAELARDLGADGWVHKGGDEDEVRRAVAEALSRRSGRDGAAAPRDRR